MRVAIDANTILSGLFFRGNERELLVESIRGRVTLVFAENVIEEVHAVIQETFQAHSDLRTALELLNTVFRAGELVARREYRKDVATWEPRLRDPRDAALIAATVGTKADCLVTGDKDLLVLERVGGIRILRTRQVLDLLAQRG